MKTIWQSILTWIVLLIIGTVIFGTITMLLWNWLMPEIFGLPEIGLFQTYGLYFLIKVLFCGQIKIKNN